MKCIDLGRLDYRKAWHLQDVLRDRRLAGEVEDHFLLVEHPPVYTFGRRLCEEDLLVSVEELERLGIDIVHTNRGGRITYHGPGQIVGYFICSLEALKMGVKDFVCAVEEVCLRTLQEFEISARRDEEHPGIWVNGNKIAAVGLNISHGISQHGFALNVTPDMTHYQYMIPCGIADRGVTSMGLTLGSVPRFEKVKESLCRHVQSVFEERGCSSVAPSTGANASSVKVFGLT